MINQSPSRPSSNKGNKNKILKSSVHCFSIVNITEKSLLTKYLKTSSTPYFRRYPPPQGPVDISIGTSNVPCQI